MLLKISRSVNKPKMFELYAFDDALYVCVIHCRCCCCCCSSQQQYQFTFISIDIQMRERKRDTNKRYRSVCFESSFRFNFLFYANHTTFYARTSRWWVDVFTFILFFKRSWLFFSASCACVYFVFWVLVYSFDVQYAKKQPILIHEMDRLSWKFQFEWHFHFFWFFFVR